MSSKHKTKIETVQKKEQLHKKAKVALGDTKRAYGCDFDRNVAKTRVFGLKHWLLKLVLGFSMAGTCFTLPDETTKLGFVSL